MSRIKVSKLEEPEESKDPIDQIIEVYFRVQDERKTTKEPEYWQGKKDGLRTALAILQPGENWDRVMESSPGYRLGENEAVLKFLKDARISIGAALWEYSESPKKYIHIYTIVNLLQWIQQYEFLAERGDVTPAPEAITPDWGLLTTGRRTKRR
jgi:hypothetical protein